MSLVDLGKRLLEAAKLGNTDEVKTLMSNGAPFTTDWLGTSPLHFAALYGHSTTAEVLIRAGISRDARTKVDRTPLHVASQEGHFAVVDLLIKAGADVDTKDMLKMTPLHWAVENGHLEIIELLLNTNCEMTSENKFDKTAMDIALYQGRYDVVEMLNHAKANRQTTTNSEETAVALETVTETISQMDNGTENAITSENMVTTGTPVTFVNANDEQDGSGEQNTAVLATLAALAEATGPIDASGVPTTNEADTLKWLESHGITMISADNSTLVASMSENGQQLALTEAGKLALSQMVKKEDEPTDEATIEEEEIHEQVIDANQDGVIVSEENIDTNDGQILVTIHPENIQTYEEEDGSGEPALKRIKMEGGEENTILTEVTEEHQHTLEYDEDAQHLGVITEVAETELVEEES